MNQLEKTILDQHARVKASGEKGYQTLGEAKGEVLAVASPERVQEILDKTLGVARWLTDPTASHLAGVQSEGSLPRQLAGLGGSLYEFSRSGLVVPSQGYVGLITLDSAGQALDAFGFSAAVGQQLQENDPIQVACSDDFFYPPMMWAKALYSEAYNNRKDSQRSLPIYVWLAELLGEGLMQGSKPTEHGLLGATGFMPSEEMMAKLNTSQVRKAHIASEPTEEFRASGLLDLTALTQLTSDLTPNWEEVLYQAKEILKAGGSLN